MASRDRKVEVKLVGNSRDLERAFKRSAAASNSFGKSLDNKAGKSLVRFAKFASVGAVAIGVGVAYGMKKSVDAASDLQESLSKTNVVFGKNAKIVQKWANGSATAMGQSSQQALEAAGTYGNLFRAFGLGLKPATTMSTTLVQLASDLASFNNTPVDDAIQALRSGLSGETEPLKRFGVAINDARLKNEAMKLGLITSTKDALSPAAKAQAAYALIMKDTTLAQGDFGRTSDGLANSQRILRASFENVKATIGTALIPIITRAIGEVGKFLDKFNQAPTLRAKLSVIVDAFQGLAWAGWSTIERWWNGTQKPLDLFIRPKIESGRELTLRILKTYNASINEAADKLGRDFASAFGGGAAGKGSEITQRLADSIAREYNPFTNSAVTAAASFVKGFLAEITRGIRAGIGDALRSAMDIAQNGISGFLGRGMDILPSGKPREKKLPVYKAPFRVGMDPTTLQPLITDIEKSLVKNKGRIESKMKALFKDAIASGIQAARNNLGSLTGTLAGMLGRINAKQIIGMTSTGTATSGKTLAEIRKDQDRVNREREKARLDDAVSSAKTDEELKQAQQDLDDWKVEEEARVLEESMAEREKAYDEDIGNLQDSFDRGLISAATFTTELEKIVGADTGTELGAGFAAAFGQQLELVMGQLSLLNNFNGVGSIGPGIVNPADEAGSAIGENNDQRFQTAWDKWEERRKARRKALQSAKEKNSKGKMVPKYTPQEIDALMGTWRENNPEPKRSAFGLAKGGILTKTVFAAGEAGPEALIPLGSSKAKSMLADAVASGGGARAGATVINVTVNGNEFSAREFADKLAPELRRRVAMTRSA